MSTSTLLYIIIAGVAALLLALFQYIYKSKKNTLYSLLAFLRFITYFLVLLLIINPKFVKESFYTEKPNLVVAIDNSESIKHLNQADASYSVLKDIQQNSILNNRFNVSYYSIGSSVKALDSLSFNESQSNISEVFSSLEQVYNNSISPMVIISDGNQTYGNDYEYNSLQYNQPIYSLILGDTKTYSDLKIQQLNVNKYSYLKNKFPVEVFINYVGNEDVNSQLIITSGTSRVYSQQLSFSKVNSSQTVEITLPANKVGVNAYKATVVPLDSEKNTVNNTKPFAVEVIDQKTNVALVSAISHPDLGTLKKSIERNEQRTVTIVTPSEYTRTKDNYQLAILYQPNALFKSVFNSLNATKDNRFIVAGSQTQWSFLNTAQNKFTQNITRQTEDFQAELNSNYNTFIIDDLDFSSFPPLTSEFGEIKFNIPYETILYKNINGTILEDPLLLTFEENSRREAILLGEHLWKWRAQSYLNTNSFETFDNFIGKLVQYLATDKQRRRLNINYESFYNGNGNIAIIAQFLNKNYEFDNKAALEIIIKNLETEESRTVPFVIKQSNYEVDLSGLAPGEYNFTIRANNGEASQSGAFTILDYNVEQQFLNADVTKLQNIATNSQGRSFFATQHDSLIASLINDSRYATIQKSSKNIVPLIDFKILLALIALSLAIEWFTRKYNGLI